MELNSNLYWGNWAPEDQLFSLNNSVFEEFDEFLNIQEGMMGAEKIGT